MRIELGREGKKCEDRERKKWKRKIVKYNDNKISTSHDKGKTK